MNKYIKLISFVLLFTIILSISSCFFELYEGPYIFWRQDRSNIEKIEICSYDGQTEKRTVISELPKEATDEIIDEISTYRCGKTYGDYPRDYCKIILCITYLDGEIEIISFVNFGYITVEGEQILIPYLMDPNNSHDLFLLMSKYVERDLLSDLKTSYPQWFVDESSSN